METIETDVVIIGGGPAGCSCALYTSRADLKTVILDKNPSVGALAITHQIANYPGVPSDILSPRNTWKDKNAYDHKANSLAKAFVQNFEQYESKANAEILAAAPQVAVNA